MEKMAFSGEFEFANQQSQFRHGGKYNSTRNAYNSDSDNQSKSYGPLKFD